VWRNAGTGANVMWLMDGASVASVAPLGSTLEWRLSATASHFDANADGHSDLVWTHVVTGVNVVSMMDGATVGERGVLGGNATWQLVAVGDFDGDGHSDLIWRDRTRGTLVMWLMENGTTRSLHVLGGSPDWTLVATMDADGDQKSDLFWRDLGNGRLVRWSMDGSTIRSRTPIGGNAVWRLIGRGVTRQDTQSPV
jgi:hypothetical protein